MATSPSSPATALLPLKNDVVLILLALSDQPLHGYGIIQDVSRRTGSTVVLQTGALYRTLKRMLADGMIEETAPPRDDSDERRRYYRPTRFGQAALAAEIDRMAALVRVARRTALVRRPRLA